MTTTDTVTADSVVPSVISGPTPPAPSSPLPAPETTPATVAHISALHARIDRLESTIGSTFRDVVSYVRNSIGEVGAAILHKLSQAVPAVDAAAKVIEHVAPAPIAAAAAAVDKVIDTIAADCPLHPGAVGMGPTGPVCTVPGCTAQLVSK